MLQGRIKIHLLKNKRQNPSKYNKNSQFSFKICDDFIENTPASTQDGSAQNSPSLLQSNLSDSFTQQCQDMIPDFFLKPMSRSSNDTVPTESDRINIENFQKEIQSKQGNINYQITKCEANEVIAQQLCDKQQPSTIKNSKLINKRKYSLDSFHKKIKRNYFNYVLNNITKTFELCPKRKEQRDISNVTIKFCQEFLSMTIKDFIKRYLAFDDKCPLKIRENYLDHDIETKLHLKLSDYYCEYLKSVDYEEMLSMNIKKEGEKYSHFLQMYSEEFLEYFSMNKTQKKK